MIVYIHHGDIEDTEKEEFSYLAGKYRQIRSLCPPGERLLT